jgi:hypothetical protein
MAMDEGQPPGSASQEFRRKTEQKFLALREAMAGCVYQGKDPGT